MNYKIMRTYRPYPISQYTLEGKIIKTFMSAHDAGRQLGISNANISSSANGTRLTAGGFIWRYRDSDYDLFEVAICQCCGKKVEPDLLVRVSAECLRKLKEYN
jgi:hypothetical protein